MDVPCFFRPRNDPRSNACLFGDRLEELAAVFGFARGAGGDGDNFIYAMGFGQTPEFRQRLEACVDGLGRKGPAVQPAGSEPDHLFLAVDDLERLISPDLDDDHVDGVGADVDGGNAHLRTFCI
jgi:hypothetical protein